MEMTTLPDLAQAVREAWTENTRRTKGRTVREGPRDYLTASNLGECARQMALGMLHPEDQDPFDDDTLERFARGDEVEAARTARLYQVGQICRPSFRVVEGQKEVEIKDRRGRLMVKGRIEGILEFEGRRRVAFELKSGRAVERIDDLDGLLRSPWGRKYLRQMLAYLYADLERRGTGQGLFILDKPGLPAFIPIDLSDDRLLGIAENTLSQAESALLARFGDLPLPDYTTDASACRRCCHNGKSCHPPESFGEGMTIDDDPEALHQVATFVATKEPRADHEAAKRFLFGDGKNPGRYRGKPYVVAGDYLVTGRWSSLTKSGVTKEQGIWRPEVSALNKPPGEAEANGEP